MSSDRRRIIDKRLMERPKRPLRAVEYREILLGLPDLRWKAERAHEIAEEIGSPQSNKLDLSVGCSRTRHHLILEVVIVRATFRPAARDLFRVMVSNSSFAIRTKNGLRGVHLEEAATFELERLPETRDKHPKDPATEEETPDVGKDALETFSIRVMGGSRLLVDADFRVDLARAVLFSY